MIGFIKQTAKECENCMNIDMNTHAHWVFFWGKKQKQKQKNNSCRGHPELSRKFDFTSKHPKIFLSHHWCHISIAIIFHHDRGGNFNCSIDTTVQQMVAAVRKWQRCNKNTWWLQRQTWMEGERANYIFWFFKWRGCKYVAPRICVFRYCFSSFIFQ